MESLQGLFEKILSSKTYVQQGLQNIGHDYHQYQILVESCKLPKHGWNDQMIELFIQQLSLMDSNNFSSNAGVGEREGRVYSSLVARRHYYLAHGIGRSGDIVEVQPKAAGSSIMYKLTNKLAAHALTIAGLSNQFSCIVFPLATGMTISLCLNALKSQQAAERRYVIWPRIDQKSCFKSILSSNLIPIIVDPILINGEMVTNVEEIRKICSERSSEIFAVLSTTSCFAPRQPDQVDKIAEICKEFNIYHVINNAYGLQCEVISKLINRAALKGTVTAVIQSTDKNFLVPVGGAILASGNPDILKLVSASYPGRASNSPIVDLFITLLSMGETGYRGLLSERQRILPVFKERLEQLCSKYSFRLLSSPRNTISFAVDITSLEHEEKAYTFLGSMLFQRSISGCRVVNALSGNISKISSFEFRNWGSHHSQYGSTYFTAACAIGMKAEEVDLFIERLEKAIKKFQKYNRASITEVEKSETEGKIEENVLTHDINEI